MRIRRNLLTLAPDGPEIASLRNALDRAYADATSTGFSVLAGIHGLPSPQSCPHHTADHAFLPWHRQYMLMFENMLRRHEPTLTLPYWDWTADPAPTPDGIPAVLRPIILGGQNTNPLAAGPLDSVRRWFATLPSNQVDPRWRALVGPSGPTQRAPGNPLLMHSAGRRGFELRPLAERALSQTRYDRFSDFIEQPHDNLHGYVGRHMGTTLTAAFDPIFWLHHANVDRQWALWQLRHPGVTQHPFPDATTTDLGNHPFRDLLDVTRLDYDYDDLVEMRANPESVLALESAEPVPGPALVFEKLQQPDGQELRLSVFASDRPVDRRIPNAENPAFLGEIFLFGSLPVVHSGHGGHGGHTMRPFARQVLLQPGVEVNPAQVQIFVTNATGETIPTSDVVLQAPIIEP